MKIVADASIIIDYLRRGDVPHVQYLEILRQGIGVMVSAVTAAELYTGESAQPRGRQRENLDIIMEGVEIAGTDLAQAKLVGKIRANNKLGLADAFVAALAISEDLPVATLDVRDFSRVSGLRIYTFDNH